MFKEFDSVRLKKDRPDLELTTNDVGAIVDMVAPGKAALVEFYEIQYDSDGEYVDTFEVLDAFLLEDLELVKDYEK